jgi:hypothetical protein
MPTYNIVVFGGEYFTIWRIGIMLISIQVTTAVLK